MSARGFAAKTQCYGNSDSGIIVTSKNTGITRFNDNSNLTGGNKKGSYVSISKKEFSFVENFTVYVFSMNKTPAFCTLFISKNQGLTWKKLGAQSFGGALVDLGSLQKNDFVELKTQGGGFKQEESHMLLFNIFNSRKRALHSPKRSLFNKHPKIEIKDHSWQGLGNKVLIGKEKKAQQNTWTPKAQLRVLSFGLFKERGAGF